MALVKVCVSLTVSDKVEPVLYGPYLRQRVGQIDLVLSCGDLPYYYLEFIVSTLDVPLFFVHGNHDVPVATQTDWDPPQHPAVFDWGTDLHGRSLHYQGLILAGLEGCRVYNPGAPFQYTENQTAWQAFRLGWALRWNQLCYGRALDLLVTHAPAYSIHDAKDVAHTGFLTYLTLLQRYKPLLMIHGHNHVYNRSIAMETDYQDVHVVNSYGYRIIELAPAPSGHGWTLISTNQ